MTAGHSDYGSQSAFRRHHWGRVQLQAAKVAGELLDEKWVIRRGNGAVRGLKGKRDE